MIAIVISMSIIKRRCLMMVTLTAFEFQNKMNNIIRIRDLTEKEIEQFCAVREKNNNDIKFHEALIRFLEFYGTDVGQALSKLFKENDMSIRKNLNIFLKEELKKLNPDPRIVNLVFKFGRERRKLFTNKDMGIYSGLAILAENYMNLRL